MGDAESEGGMTDTDKEDKQYAARIAALVFAFLEEHVARPGWGAARRDIVKLLEASSRNGSRMAVEEATKVFKATQSGGGE